MEVGGAQQYPLSKKLQPPPAGPPLPKVVQKQGWDLNAAPWKKALASECVRPQLPLPAPHTKTTEISKLERSTDKNHVQDCSFRTDRGKGELAFGVEAKGPSVGRGQRRPGLRTARHPLLRVPLPGSQ